MFNEWKRGDCQKKKKKFYIYIYIYVMELGNFLTLSGLTYPQDSSKVYHDFFCQLRSSISLPWVIYFEEFYLHVLSSFQSCYMAAKLGLLKKVTTEE